MKHLLITIAVVLFVVFVQADSKPYKGKVHQIPGKIEAEHYDEGAIIFQASTEVAATDTPEMVAQKIHSLEYAHFPKVIEEVVNG